jgi:hypothetical protein
MMGGLSWSMTRSTADVIPVMMLHADPEIGPSALMLGSAAQNILQYGSGETSGSVRS